MPLFFTFLVIIHRNIGGWPESLNSMNEYQDFAIMPLQDSLDITDVLFTSANFWTRFLFYLNPSFALAFMLLSIQSHSRRSHQEHPYLDMFVVWEIPLGTKVLPLPLPLWAFNSNQKANFNKALYRFPLVSLSNRIFPGRLYFKYASWLTYDG